MKKGKEKEENYIRKGGKGLKNASFWAASLFVGEKNWSQKGGGVNDQNAQYISLSRLVSDLSLAVLGQLGSFGDRLKLEQLSMGTKQLLKLTIFHF